MGTSARKSRDLASRLQGRLRQRCLRWLARQPVESVWLSKSCRSFWRGYRRRIAFLRSRPATILAFCLAVAGLLFALGAAVTFVACVIPYLPELFFAPPQYRSFAGPAQRSAVALTRVTVFESVVLPLLFLWATLCFRSRSGLETRSFDTKFPRLRLVSFHIAFLCFLTCSAAVTVGAMFGHGVDVVGIVASLTVLACWGWLAWGVARWLMAVRWPSRPPSSEQAPAAAILLLLAVMMTMIPGSHLLFGPAILVVSRHLVWLGPFGYANGLLLGLSLGQAENLLPLGIGCTATVYVAYRLHHFTATWAFRRRLLSTYRLREPARKATIATTDSTSREEHVAADLRQALGGTGPRPWKAWLWPPWMKGHAPLVLLLCGSVFLTQCLLAGIVLFVAYVEAQSGQVLEEKLTVYAVLSSAAGWNVLLMEGLAIGFRYQEGLSKFARRPVSPGQVWKRLQREGLSFAPTQALFALPFLALTAAVAPGYAVNSCLALVGTLLACVAIRTTLSAGACYLASIVTFRSWITSLLSLLGMLALWLLIAGTLGSGLTMGVSAERSLGEFALILGLQQVVTLAALGISWRIWHVAGTLRGEAPPTRPPRAWST